MPNMVNPFYFVHNIRFCNVSKPGQFEEFSLLNYVSLVIVSVIIINNNNYMCNLYSIFEKSY